LNHVILPIIAHEMFVDSLRNSKKYFTVMTKKAESELTSLLQRWQTSLFWKSA